MVYGYAGNDVLTGGSSVDRLSGGVGDNNLNGSGGNDFLLSEGTKDVLTGGDGTDKFYFSNAIAVDGAATKATTIVATGDTNLKTITDFNASGEKILFQASAGAAPVTGTTFFGNATTLTDKAWNATTGVALNSDGQVVNVGTLATVVGETTVTGDLLDLFAGTATAGKIFLDTATAAAAFGSIIVFNSARDNATYAAIVNESDATAGYTATQDSLTLIKLTGVAVADLSAADFSTYANATTLVNLA